MLGGPNVRMSEHLRYTFNRNAVQKRNRWGECVAGNMRSQLLFYSAQVGNFIQVFVHLLVAGNWKKQAFIEANFVGGISIDNFNSC